MSNQPPPQRTVAPTPAPAPADPAAGGWKSKMKARGTAWGKIAMDKTVAISDNVGGKVNNIAEKKFGTEHFWPVTGDFGREMDKCARILRTFTVEGVVNEEPESPSGTSTPVGTDDDGKAIKKKKVKKVLRKIPPKAIANAKGLVIFTSMRTGFAPFGGAGGAGVVIAKLPDGSWSGPASISPNNLSAGFLIGIDVYDAVLVINSQKALDSFKTHKATLGGEIGIAAGPYGAGASVEAGIEKTPIWSYVKSKGMYAGIEVVGQVFVERFDENAAMYNWPGVKAGDILAGKTRIPHEAAELHRAIQDAETGRAQAANPLKSDGAEVIQNADGEMIIPDAGGIVLEDGEILNLPPTPSMMVGEETGNGEKKSIDVSTAGEKSAPTPPRLPSRPSVIKNVSSTSNYAPTPEALSDSKDPFISAPIGDPSSEISTSSLEPAPTHPDDLPPAYLNEAPSYSTPHTAATPQAGHIEDEMSESEKREWAEAEELIRLEKEEMEKLQSGPGSSHNLGPQGTLSAEVQDMKLDNKA